MNITLTIPDTISTQTIENVCTATGFNQKQPLTKKQWVEAHLKKQIEALSSRGAQMTASKTAEQTWKAALAANPIT